MAGELVLIVWVVTTLPTMAFLVVFYWRRLVASVWLPAPQPPICSRRAPFVAPAPEDPALRSKWIKRWAITGSVTVVLLLTFWSSGMAGSARHDDTGLTPSWWVTFWYNFLGTLMLIPWSESIADGLAGCWFLYSWHKGLPLPNRRPSWRKERWCFGIGIWIWCLVASLETAYFWTVRHTSNLDLRDPSSAGLHW